MDHLGTHVKFAMVYGKLVLAYQLSQADKSVEVRSISTGDYEMIIRIKVNGIDFVQNAILTFASGHCFSFVVSEDEALTLEPWLIFPGVVPLDQMLRFSPLARFMLLTKGIIPDGHLPMYFQSFEPGWVEGIPQDLGFLTTSLGKVIDEAVEMINLGIDDDQEKLVWVPPTTKPMSIFQLYRRLIVPEGIKFSVVRLNLIDVGYSE